MNDLQIYVNCVIKVLQGLKSECEKNELCRPICKLYNKEVATCFLRSYPCDYDLQAIEKAVYEIIKEEQKKEENE